MAHVKGSPPSASLQTPLQYAAEACRCIMNDFTPAELPPAGRWHYHQGVFLCGMLQLWEETKEQDYFDYIQGYADHIIDRHGNLLCERGELDSVQAGLILFTLHKETGDERYKTAAERLLKVMNALNLTSEGGYWHKDRYPNQMWLDGLYMGGAFKMKYGQMYGIPQLYDEVLLQERLMRSHMKDEQTGLYYHAWDESRETAWSDDQSGCSPEFWGRALGWYALSLVEFLDVLPENHSGREDLVQSLQELAKALVSVQEPKSGLWYQVLDKGDLEDNWLETSCSSLFVYTLSKGVRLGVLDPSFIDAARSGYNGLLSTLYYSESGKLVMPEICIGTGVGDYKHYVERPRCENDLHGVGALVMAFTEMQRHQN
ncbi:glycoside hydrolase family 88/105 protein [Paenibacillus lemnae]|uniref:Glycoside hydrolase 105 family protein n=1 Tax=Paenibacillus lemnae TaxID=1330551 RepID=A0A848M661_PAELE|nr:glycoside hydrolase family 88 protein [Paenibacillus lemnae]NMO96225.1 glycoside hydrolase 105 family protein [Paenibacillus lemnae]